MKKLLIAAMALMITGTGCATKIRNITAETWEANGKGVYIGYWEGTCKVLLGCNAGDGHVKWCTIQADNSLTCVEQDSVNTLLLAKEVK